MEANAIWEPMPVSDSKTHRSFPASQDETSARPNTNRASSGIFSAKLLEKLGLKEALGVKIVVVDTGSAVMKTVVERGPGAVGLAQISEIMVMVDKGCAIRLAAPLPDLRFCPTGGIDLQKAPEYLRLPNVPCVGGSWMLQKAALAAGDYLAVEALSRDAAGLTRAAA